jgi:hypothetical protein
VSEKKQSSEACACVRKPRGGGATTGETARAEETVAGTGPKKGPIARSGRRECKILVLEDGGQGALTGHILVDVCVRGQSSGVA